jgi:dipeptidyl aminopeptidase/acylaminoacyl peptidase
MPTLPHHQSWPPFALTLTCLLCSITLAQEPRTLPDTTNSGPDARQITDPRSILSAANASAKPIPIPDLFFTRDVFDPSWSPDGNQIVFTTDFTGRPNLWKVNSRGGWPIQLVQSDDLQTGAAWSPDGKWIAYQQDFGGNEQWDIFVVPADGGEPVNLTNSPDIREKQPLWSPDGSKIAVNYKSKASAAYDIAILDWATRKLTPLTHESNADRSWSSVAWSPDGKTIYANRIQGNNAAADVYAVDVVSSGKITSLTAGNDKAINLATSLSSDGHTLLLTSDARNGYENVALLDIATKNLTWLTDTKWQAEAADFSPTGKSLTYTLNVDGIEDAYLFDLATRRAEKVPLASGLNYFPGHPTSFSPSGGRILLNHGRSVEPANFWIYDMASHNVTPLSHSAIANLNTAALSDAQVVHYKSFDGKVISALLWVPPNLRHDASNPAIVIPHGGPTWQLIDFWNPLVVALVSRGYICIAPNVRGSTGYGIDFQRANYKDLGGGDLQDEVYATKFLTATGYVSPHKIGITGASYGGFMTLMAIGKTPDTWAAAVDMFGVIDWITMLHTSDPELQQHVKDLLGDPIRDKSIYEAASPKTYLHNAKAPLLVLQGDNDPRVPKEEAEQVVSLLERDHKVIEAHFYANEGHGLAKRENQIDSIQRTVAWFERYLRTKGGQ